MSIFRFSLDVRREIVRLINLTTGTGEFSTIASGQLAGRVSNDNGIPESVAVGSGLRLANGQLEALDEFLQSGTGAMTRSQLAKLREIVSINDFLFGNDHTSAFELAVAYLVTRGGGILYVPAGIYVLTRRITTPASYSIQIMGEGRFATVIHGTSGVGIFQFDGAWSGYSRMRLEYPGAYSEGDIATVLNAPYCSLHEFTIQRCDTGIRCQAVGAKMSQFDILDYSTAGAIVQGTNDIFFNQFVMNAGNTTRGALGGIRLVDKAEAVNATDGDILLGAYSMTTDAASDTLGNRPAYNKFNGVYFDSAAGGVAITKSVEFDFTNCWFSNRPSSGITLSSTDGMRFTGGQAVNCGQNGVLLGSGAVRTSFSNFKAGGNSTIAANTYHGIAVTGGVSDFSIMGCQLGGALGFGTQGYGVLVNSGASDRYIIADNLVSGNGTGGVADGGTGVNKRVANNY